MLTLVAGASATLAAPAETQVILLPRKFTIMVTFDPDEIWQRIEWADDTVPPQPGVREALSSRAQQ